MASEIVVQLTPYPASFIVEHAKRKRFAAGYIIGTRTAEEIVITDFIPLTHKDTEVPNTRAYREELHRRRAAKRRFTKQDPIGWYTAGQADEQLSPEDYQRWCNAPSIIFQNRNCLHLHCEMPYDEAAVPEILWTASIISEDPEDHTLKYSNHKVVVAPLNSLSSDVMINHITSIALYNGGHPYPRSKLLNIDEVAYLASLDNKTSTDAVNDEQRKLQKAVTAAEQIVTGGSGGSREAQEMIAAVESFRAIREEALQRQRDQTGRVDFNSQQFKDALTIKCAATILRKELTTIEMLSTMYAEDKERRPNGEGGEEGAAKDSQQQQQQQQQQAAAPQKQ
ncbi:hypothetical protein ABB37_05438 [Leptomonas pyrrhocoris]|uniref:JAB1/MPN/MOV34 metalloenzyme domain-containing protein n=1 Tax=Leptomonas pyrrhocoris TaxID=157538 RepID=A0A0N0DV11_LEPPY|nr:hypothetical protein ABB37_05438 [Leptomonas pyrrhocoris]KPA79648.1 hypothetical protein ABB37_05438 [Leptomonas pyrrhocoris]|eukprot:XP_015658087.1 hypothetical protein ABB37_05438 [Leptomonas pyrrhocoris]